MGLTGKAKSSNEGWGMGFLLVFFPEDEAVINKKKTMINTLLRRSNSNHLLTRAQSTISICALLIFITLLLFTLSTFEPTTTNHFTSRKHLSSNPPILYKTSRKFPHSPPPWPISLITNHKSRYRPKITSLPSPTSHALQGMGTLYRRGTRAMDDLIVAHVHESLTAHDLRLFLRVLHRSGLTSRSDIVFIFPSASQSSEFDGVIGEENDSFLKLIRRYEQTNGTEVNSRASFDATQFVKLAEEKERKEPIWGRRIRSNYSEEGEGELTRLSYGSVVGFLVEELDPENSLAGFLFLDHVPMSLRRWACYPLLLGRVRRNFKHTMLVDVKEILVVGDPFGRVRNRSPESVYLSTVSESTTPNNNKHGRKKAVKTEPHKLVNPMIIVGGARGVRGLSNAMLTEIARAAMQQKRKNSMSESGLFQQLVGNGFLLKNVNLISSTESIPDASSLTGLNLNSGSLLSLSNHTVIRRGNSNIDVTSIIMKQMCSLELYSAVYCDC